MFNSPEPKSCGSTLAVSFQGLCAFIDREGDAGAIDTRFQQEPKHPSTHEIHESVQ
jgi:hypothetical protein